MNASPPDATRTMVIRRPPTSVGRVDRDGRSSPQPGWLSHGPLLLGGVGVGLWWVSLNSIDLAKMTDYGLLPALPHAWFLGVGLALAGAVAAICRQRPSAAVVVLLIGAVVLMLYGTIPLVTDVPQYSWTYKHVGVTEYIELHGSVNPDVDIYHRWPGFFAVAAMFSTVAGAPNPIAYAAWSEVFFTGLVAVLVAAIGHRLLGSARLGWLAALLYVLSNWVGQSYFAPQALALALAFGTYLLILEHYGRPRPTWLLRLLLRLTNRFAKEPPRLEAVGLLEAPDENATGPSLDQRAPSAEPAERTLLIRRPGRQARDLRATTHERPPRSGDERPTGAFAAGWPRPATIALILLLFLAAVSSHQLTPYMVVAGVAVLSCLGLVRPWWLAVALGAVAVAYFVPNYRFVQDHYGIFTGLDLLSNMRTSGVESAANPRPGVLFFNSMASLMILVTLLLGVTGLVRGLRRGNGNVLFAGGLIMATGLVIAGQNYGGEASLRVVLFAGPWLCILGARALAPADMARWSPRRALLVLPACGLLLALFLPAYFGKSELNIRDADEIAAWQYAYANATPGETIIAGAPSFPVNLAGNYDQFPREVPTFLEMNLLKHPTPTTADVESALKQLGRYGEHSFVVLSRSQLTYLDVNRDASPETLTDLERGLAASGHFSLLYQNTTTRVYEFSAAAGQQSSPPAS